MPNDETRSTWTEAGVGWVEHEAVFDAVFAPVTRAVLDAAAIGPGHRVLDVGCGSGTLLAAAAGLGAEPVGVDLSPTMVAGARRRVPSAVVVEADAQTTDVLDLAPGRPFDRVVSRFGVMFFDDPVSAFTRLRGACAPGARMAFACWRTYAENPTFRVGQDVLVAWMDEPPAPAASPFAPGPMAFADPGHVRAVLEEAGWADVAPAPVDVTLDYAHDGTDGVENRLAVVLATTTGHRASTELRPRIGEERWAELLDAVRARLGESLVDGALRLPGAVWVVTATA